MAMKVDFVKGHCGWDTVTLVPAGQIPVADELDAALKILSPPVSGGLEVGFVDFGRRRNEIRLRIVASTQRSWIPMCGGMTQVIGKAMVETFFRELFEVDVYSPVINVMTDAGLIPIRIEVEDERVRRMTTVMDCYVSYLYEQGVEPLKLHDIEVLRVGDYIVINMDALGRKHPAINFTRRDQGAHLDIINGLLATFGRSQNLSGVSGMMYDRRPEGPGQFRIFPRFFSPDLAAARVPWEFQCGTGTVATGIALSHCGQLPFSANIGCVLFEWGSHHTTPDPYGIRTTKLDLELANGRVKHASFSHSVVEILAEGKLTLPGY